VIANICEVFRPCPVLRLSVGAVLPERPLGGPLVVPPVGSVCASTSRSSLLSGRVCTVLVVEEGLHGALGWSGVDWLADPAPASTSLAATASPVPTTILEAMVLVTRTGGRWVLVLGRGVLTRGWLGVGLGGSWDRSGVFLLLLWRLLLLLRLVLRLVVVGVVVRV
jgi:hypothetical protein